MGRLLQFQIELISERRFNHSKKRLSDSTERRRSSITTRRDWSSLRAKLKRLAILAPATAKSLEAVVDKMLEQLAV